MNVKALTTSAVTAALVAALGLAYAQTTSGDSTQQPADSTAPPMPSSTTPGATTATPSDASATTSTPSSSPTSPSDDRTMSEPVPQADRG